MVGGTALGQLIAILALPVLTRLYDPEAFSALAVYASLLSLLTVVACLRFEIAIPIPKEALMAAALCVLAISSVIGMSLLTLLIILLFPDQIVSLTGEAIRSYLWLLPAGVFAVGMYNALQYWSTRNKKYRLIAKTRVSQSLSGTGVKLGAGYFFLGSTPGLIAGQLVSQGAGFVSLGTSLLHNDVRLFRRLRMRHLRLAFKRYDKFPKYSTLEALANAGGIQIPVILIAGYAVGPEAGYLMIAMQLLSAPMSLIGNSVAQVYLAEGSERHHKGELKSFTLKTVAGLAKVAILPLTTVALVSPWLMPVVLGENWQRTGVFISWMVPWFFMQFITSPVSMVLHITGNQKLAFVLQLSGSIIRIGGVVFAAVYFSRGIGEIYAVSGFVFYTLYFFVIVRVLIGLERF